MVFIFSADPKNSIDTASCLDICFDLAEQQHNTD